jgi:hypothetical protein
MDDRLEAELRALSAHLETPATPDLTEAVRARLTTPPRRTLRSRLPLRLRSPFRLSLRVGLPVRWRRLAYALLAAVVLAAATPQGRAFAGHLLRFAGVEFSSTPGPTPAAFPSLPGEVSETLEQARKQVGFPIRVPSALGRPDGVTVSDQGRVVTLHYGNLRLDEFDGRVNEPFFGKFIAGDPEHYKRTKVGKATALWVLGGNEVWYIGHDGQSYTASARTAGNTLIWQAGASAMRLEGVTTLPEALRIALSTN